jgi:hypothetical protein
MNATAHAFEAEILIENTQYGLPQVEPLGAEELELIAGGVAVVNSI